MIAHRQRRDAPAAAVRLGAWLSWRRLARPTTWWLVGLACAASVAVAAVERFHAPVGATDRTLTVVTGLVIPLLCFALVSRATAGARLADAVWPLARHGVSRRGLVVGQLAAVMLLAALFAVVASLLGLAMCHRELSSFAADGATTAWVVALGAAAYVAWFGFGATVMPRGRGRYLPLLADFTLGFGVGGAAVAWPRAHLSSLIGGPAVLGLPQSSSSVALGGSAVALLLASALRVPD